MGRERSLVDDCNLLVQLRYFRPSDCNTHPNLNFKSYEQGLALVVFGHNSVQYKREDFNGADMTELILRILTRLPCILSLALLSLILPRGVGATSCTPAASSYAVRGDQVWFTSRYPDSNQIVKGVDTATFRDISPYSGEGPCAGRINDYARDKDYVIYRGNILAGADPDTFVFIDGIYTKDKSAVYSGATRLTNRVKEFRRLPIGVWATDGQHYFYKETKLEGDGFEEIPNSYQYARTSTTVYNGGKVLTADAASFEIIQASVAMSKDKNKVYFDDRPITGADPATITQIYGYLFKDKRAVYKEGREIVGLNPMTVRTFPLDTRYTADESAVFLSYKRIDRDPATFSVLQPFYTKDKNAVYYEAVAIEFSDPATFVSTSMSSGYDKNYRFLEHRIECKINPAAKGLALTC